MIRCKSLLNQCLTTDVLSETTGHTLILLSLTDAVEVRGISLDDLDTGSFIVSDALDGWEMFP